MTPFIVRNGVRLGSDGLPIRFQGTLASGSSVSMGQVATVPAAAHGSPVAASSVATGPPGPPGPPGQPGAPGVPGSSGSSGTVSGTNRDTSPANAGAASAIHPSGVGFILAYSAPGGRPVFGLFAGYVAAGYPGSVVLGGPVTMTDWTPVTGSVELSPAATYYLGSTPGTLTNTPPTDLGSNLQEVGVAIGPNTLDVSIGPPILL